MGGNCKAHGLSGASAACVVGAGGRVAPAGGVGLPSPGSQVNGAAGTAGTDGIDN